jgi:opacity protein-like surface antigen
MKKKLFVLTICLSFLLLLPGSIKAGKLKFGIKISGGMNHMSLGDPNTVLNSKSDHYNQVQDSVDKDFKEVHWGLDFEMKVMIYLNSRFGLSIGTGYIQAKSGKDAKEMTLENTPISDWQKIYDVKTSAIPILIGAFYNLPLSSKTRFFLNGGVGYYFSKYSEYNLNRWNSGDSWNSHNIEANKASIGFHGGFGFEYDISKNISLVFEGQGRYAKISGFEGEKVSENSDGPQDPKEGILYHYEGTQTEELNILSGTPDPDKYKNVREAEIDFSGFTIRAGIKIRF